VKGVALLPYVGHSADTDTHDSDDVLCAWDHTCKFAFLLCVCHCSCLSLISCTVCVCMHRDGETSEELAPPASAPLVTQRVLAACQALLQLDDGYAAISLCVPLCEGVRERERERDRQ
jgi:hypothetical protein